MPSHLWSIEAQTQVTSPLSTFWFYIIFISRFYVAVYLISYGSQMTLEYGENIKVTHKGQLSVSLLLATMQYEQYKLITIQYVHKFFFHLFL